MGLPLFIPPVESDVPSKPSAKSPADPAHARSPIRRSERRRQLNEIREHRLRMLAALQADDDSSPLPPITTRSASRPTDAHRGSERQSPRLENPRISELTQHHLELERRYLDRTATGELSRSFGLDDLDDAWDQLSHILPPRLIDTVQSSTSQRPAALSSESSRYDPVVYTASGLSGRWRERDREMEEARRRRRRQIENMRPTGPRAAHRHAQRVRHFGGHTDGLGDRDRSLSPEGDGAWDTLQSTLTPDPQPPSVGSSFASTTASAAASQSNGASSVNTSMTTPDEETEQPCDPVMYNSGSEGEDDDEEQSNELSRQPMRHSRRSYADVAAEPQSRQSPEAADAPDADRLEWLSGMHRIVRGLALREDIPDEWWAQAGLSRSMSWEEST
ncbi:hypothetical protein F5Y19DRAFT_489054 [Xylariaceae sp. FL1651]|nr:hypothetical protein F5Y19DRAFT_489054 [Xylariaceae sp. FL1651]